MRYAWLAWVVILTAGAGWALETEVLFDGQSADDWTTSRDATRLHREFSLSDLAISGEPPALHWRFVSRGVTFNDIFLMRPVDRPFAALRVRVQNEGAPLKFALKVGGADAAEWTVEPVPLPAGADWQWLEFPREAWHVASWSKDADGSLDFPLGFVTLIAFELRPDVTYDLRVSRIEAVRPDAPLATLTRLDLPQRLEAGKSYPLTLTFNLNKPCADDAAYLALRRGTTEMVRMPLRLPRRLSELAPGETVSVSGARVRIPRYAFGGQASVILRLGEARVVGPDQQPLEEVATVTVTPRESGQTVAEVRRYHGAPTLFINGEPHNGMAWACYGPSPEVFADFARAGIRLYTFSATPTEAGYGLSQTSWTAPDTYDFSQLDQRALMLLQECPDAYFFPRLYVHAPKWWSEQHPQDIVLMDPGDGKPVPLIHAGGKPAPSWASEQWRRDTIEGLRRLIAHVEASPYADRVVGYHIASGTTEEWMMWGANEDEWVDYSPVNVARFRQWLAERYHTDAALKRAWNDPQVTLATAAIPTKAQRQRTELGNLRDPAQEQAVIDFYEYNSDLVADTINVLARAVKDITRRRKTVGVFYGYLLQLCGEQRQQNAGHLALAKVLASPDIDFVCSPTSYAFRQLGGEGTSHFMSLLGSVREHGKLWFDENDIRTSLSGGQTGEWGRPADIAGDLIQQDKELANVIVNGVAQWWFDVGGNRYNDPALMGRIGKLAQCATAAQAADRTPADEVAMVVDERSLCYLRVGDPLGAWLLVSQLPALHRIGAPIGHYLVTDLPRLQRHRLFLIMTSFAPTAADRRAVDALKRDGNVLVFFHTPGLYRGGQLDETAMAEFTGIRLRLSRTPTLLRVTLQGSHELTDGLDLAGYGQDHVTFPVAYADDPEAEVLGTLADGKPGLVVKPHQGWTAVHSSAPMMPAVLLRRLAQLAGVHCYLDTEDQLWASRDLIGVCAKAAGRRTVRLPRAAAVSDLYSGEEVSRKCTSFEAAFEANQTRVFVLRGDR
ncbi:MAG: hypothetical protein HPY69_12600 [Armatimonadetes bacterium]|nr:hypothetical protein [Armatimonadota bacterium]